MPPGRHPHRMCLMPQAHWRVMTRYYCDYCDTYLTHDSVWLVLRRPCCAVCLPASCRPNAYNRSVAQPVVRNSITQGTNTR